MNERQAPEVKVGTLDVGEQTLETLWVSGSDDGPTLLLLHEGLGSLAGWKRFPVALGLYTGRPVVAYSRAGYGNSSPVLLPRPLDFHMREACEVLPAVIDALGLERCILMGHSDGASIALAHAGSVLDQRVQGVVALAPHVLTEAKTVDAIRKTSAAFESGTLRERLARYHGENVDCAFRGWADTWLDPRFQVWSIESALAGIKVPVLAIRGRSDPYNTAVHLERIAALVTAPVKRITLEDCGHAPHAERTDDVLALVRRFIDSLPRP